MQQVQNIFQLKILCFKVVLKSSYAILKSTSKGKHPVQFLDTHTHTQPAFAEQQRRPERQTGISYWCMTPISHRYLQANLSLLVPSFNDEVEIEFCQITYAVQSIGWAQLQHNTNLSLPNARSSNRRPFQQILPLYVHNT